MVALDDFGTGFNSFTHLKELEIDILKIDGTFVRNITHNQTDRILVRSIADIAGKLGITTIAEFVEDQETLYLLGTLGVDYAQGYHIGRPGPLPA